MAYAVIRPGAMKRTAIVPYDQVVEPPMMSIDGTRLCTAVRVALPTSTLGRRQFVSGIHSWGAVGPKVPVTTDSYREVERARSL
jgi:hypothetical protein